MYAANKHGCSPCSFEGALQLCYYYIASLTLNHISPVFGLQNYFFLFLIPCLNSSFKFLLWFGGQFLIHFTCVLTNFFNINPLQRFLVKK